MNKHLDETQKIIKRLKELAKLIDKHNHYYHNEDKPKINDSEYDKLVRENLEIESNYPNLKLPESTSSKVGSKIQNKFVKSSHLSPMHSLANGFNEDDLIEFDERVKKFLNINLEHELEYICEPKIDGLSLNLTYKNGNLITAATRGDGKIGENVTENIKNIDIFAPTLKRKLGLEQSFKFKNFVNKTTKLNKKYDLIINASSAGMVGKPKLNRNILSLVANAKYIIDIVYNPTMTDLLKRASFNDKDYIGGLKMLIEQAKPSFEIWTGKSIKIDKEIYKKVEQNI